MMIVVIGFIIGFIGYLNVGNINLSVVELSVARKRLITFLFFVITAEFVYCYFSLFALRYVINSERIIFFTKWLSVFLLFFIGIWCFADSRKNNEELGKGIVRRGYFSVFVHPQQISFWLIWGTILFQNGILNHEASSLLLFALLNSAGSLAVLITYAYAGKKMYFLFERNKSLLSKVAGGFSIVLCALQLFSLLIG